MPIDKSFMDVVQLHERKWGDTQYPGRPALLDLFNAHIVALWIIGKRFILSAHETHEGLNVLVHQIIIGEVTDGRKLGKVFVDQKPSIFSAGIAFVREDSRPTVVKLPPKSIPEMPPQPKHQPIRPGDVISVPLSISGDGQPIRQGDLVFRAAPIVDPSKQPLRPGVVVIKTGLEGKMKKGRDVQLRPMNTPQRSVIKRLKKQDE